MEHVDTRKLPIAAINERRRRAVKLRLAGMTVRETARQCELALGTVVKAQRAYKSGGWKAVAVRREGRPVGSGRRLSREQERAVERVIRERTPDQLKMPYALWTRQAVSEWIASHYGIRLQVRTMGKYLARWGFTPQKPLKKAFEQSPAAVGKWLKEEYPAIAARAREEGGEIHWGDETGLRTNDVRGRGYAPRGETPMVRIKSKHESLSVISTVTNKGQMRWQVYRGALNVRILIGFLKRLIKNSGRKIFLVLDNLRVHHGKLVQQWLAAHRGRIEVFYLPSYSPELNPDELLNADLKRTVTTQMPIRTGKALARTASRTLRSIQKQPRRVQRYFGHPDVLYAA